MSNRRAAGAQETRDPGRRLAGALMSGTIRPARSTAICGSSGSPATDAAPGSRNGPTGRDALTQHATNSRSRAEERLPSVRARRTDRSVQGQSPLGCIHLHSTRPTSSGSYTTASGSRRRSSFARVVLPARQLDGPQDEEQEAQEGLRGPVRQNLGEQLAVGVQPRRRRDSRPVRPTAEASDGRRRTSNR